MRLRNIACSLEDLLGASYCEAVAGANEALGLQTRDEALAILRERAEFYSDADRARNHALLEKVGEQIAPPFTDDVAGAGTRAFMKAAHPQCAPLTGAGAFRVGQDGRLYLLGKSEHYHASLGHAFGGYRLIDNARRAHILNATHNNTRGYVTRLCERALIAAANGVAADDPALEGILASESPKVLNRVINLETGSVAAEAGIKMMLSRFLRLDGTYAAPKYEGRVPVFFVMADESGGPEANYHGTSVMTQTMRGLWPDYARAAADAGLYRVVPVAINDAADFAAKLDTYDRAPYKVAGFVHEIILMNYGGVRLTEDYLHEVYALCAEHDVPTFCDEIQSCMWYREPLLFRLYELHPDMCILGKGFPGGEYPASKILVTAEYDTLNQFGALVTNGQEELASLAYLVTMRFAKANADVIESNGERFESGLHAVAARYSGQVKKAEGRGLLGALHFGSVDTAARFAAAMNAACVDTSAQLYKAHCPPAVLLKPPLVAEEAHIDYLLAAIEAGMSSL